MRISSSVGSGTEAAILILGGAADFAGVFLRDDVDLARRFGLASSSTAPFLSSFFDFFPTIYRLARVSPLASGFSCSSVAHAAFRFSMGHHHRGGHGRVVDHARHPL